MTAVTDEDAFQAALDANPDDHTTRLVLADWLEERGDKRAAGYRALGMLQRVASSQPGEWSWIREENIFAREILLADSPLLPFALPSDWIGKMRSSPKIDYTNTRAGWRQWPTRREADDAAALAFAKLPAKRRAELLAPAAATT